MNILHCHSTYSLHDSAVEPADLVKKAKEMGAMNITLTDHGTTLGWEPFLEAGRKHGINAIPGIELYLENKEHLIMVARNYQGYKDISRLMRDAAYTEARRGKRKTTIALVTYDALAAMKGNENVIVTSACIKGPIAKALLHNSYIQKKLDKVSEKAQREQKEAEDYESASLQYTKIKEDLKALRKEKKELDKYTTDTYKKKVAKLKEESMVITLFGNSREAEYLMYREMMEHAIKRMPEIDKEIRRLNRISREISVIKAATKNSHDSYKNTLKKAKDLSAQMMTEKMCYEKALETASFLKDTFPHFYIELQYHGMPKEKEAAPLLVSIARGLGIPLIAANDAHMLDPSEKSIKARQLLRYNYFSRHAKIVGPERELYLKDQAGLEASLSGVVDREAVDESISNLEILSQCHVEIPKEKHYPRLPGIDAEKEFVKVLEEKRSVMIRKREWSDIHEERLRHETRIIKDMGFIDYHLVVRDFCIAGRKLDVIPPQDIHRVPEDFGILDAWIEKRGYQCEGVSIGPGRGSAAGSLVCYMLGITNIDPIKYGLLFERFLNPERISMPDIDTDIATSKRGLLIRYLKWKYGEKAVCSISTETRYGAKAAIQLAGRDRADYLYSDISTDKKRIDKEKARYMQEHVYPLSDLFGANESLSDRQDIIDSLGRGSEEFEIWSLASLVEGRLSGTGIHAGGLVISDNDDINEYVPLAWNMEKQVWAAQCDMLRIEEKGMLKVDVLGLGTLDVISDTIHMVYENTGSRIDIDNIPFEKEVFRDIYASGNTTCIFQVESAGMRSMMKAFGPDCFEDIILLIAAYRPGPMQYIDDMIGVKTGRKKISYITKELEPILKGTYGSIIYQEQVILIFRELAGYSMGQADLVRRYMSKKKTEYLKKEKRSFVYGDNERDIPGCAARGIAEADALRLFDEMTEFAKYCFNKSHAAGYAKISYQTAWLKYHYPKEFLCAMFNNKPQDKYQPIIEDCRKARVKLLPVSVNRSFHYFVTEGEGIRYGFIGIKQISDDSLSNEIIKNRTERPYESFSDFTKRVCIRQKEDDSYSQVEKTPIENLILTGAFDEVYPSREELLLAYDAFTRAFPKARTKKAIYKLADGIIPCEDREDKSFNRKKEMELLGAIIKNDPLEGFASDKDVNCTPFDELTEGTHEIFGLVTEEERFYSKKGNPYLKIRLRGLSGSMNVMKFRPDPEESYFGKVIKVSGKYSKTFDNFIVDHIHDLRTDRRDEQFIIRTGKDLERYISAHMKHKQSREPKTINLYVINTFDRNTGRTLLKPQTAVMRVSEKMYEDLVDELLTIRHSAEDV